MFAVFLFLKIVVCRFVYVLFEQNKPMNEQGSSPEMQSSTHSQQSKSPHHFPLSVHVDIHRIESNITFGDVVEKIIPDFFEINKKSATQFDMPLPEGFANTTK